MLKKALSVCMVSLFLLNGCSDEIIGTGVQGLKMPARVEILTPKAETPSAAIVQTIVQNNFSTSAISDVETDYSKDKAITYTRVELQKDIDSPNIKLCILDKLKLDKMVNKGPYKALVNQNLCYNLSNTDTDKTPSYISVTAISQRKDNDSPQIIKAWLQYPMLQSNTAAFPSEEVLMGNIAKSAGSDNPYGEFYLSSKYVVDDGLNGGIPGEELTLSRATTKAGNDDNGEIYFKTVLSHQQGQHSTSLNLDPADQQKGRILVKSEQLDPLNPRIEYRAGQFDSDYMFQENLVYRNQVLLRDSQICNSRNEYVSDVFDYGLYHEKDGMFRERAVTAGQRLNLVKSKLVTYNNIYANISPTSYVTFNGASIPDGATVYADAASSSEPNSSNTAEAYTFHFSPGVFTRRSADAMPLSELSNRALQYSGLHPNPLINTFGTWSVRVLDNEFYIESAIEYVNGSYKFSSSIDHDADPATAEIPVISSLVFSDGQISYYHDFSKPDSYTYEHISSVAANERSITKTGPETIVLSSDPQISASLVTLYCYRRCPKGGITQTMVDNAVTNDDLYHVTGFSETPFLYTISSQDHKTILTDMSNNQIVDAYGLVPPDTLGQPNVFIATDKLLTQALAEPATIQLLGRQEQFYRWQTSNSVGNHLVTLIDSSLAEVTYDPDLYISYTHDASNDRDNPDPNTNPYHGNLFTFFNGHLSGVNRDNGAYRPLINLRDGTPISNEEGNFLIKANVILQSLAAVPLDQCGHLNQDMFSDSSMAQLLTNEDLIPVDLERADKPEVEGPPIFIDGEWQK